MKDPTVLIIKALLYKSPATIADIYSYIEKNIGIKFDPKKTKIERTIEENNRFMRFFIEKEGLYRLNVDNRYLREILKHWFED